MLAIKDALYGVAMVMFSIFISSELLAQADEIVKRRQLMESNNDAVVKALKDAVAAKDYAAIQVKTKEIKGQMDQLLPLFPKGSLSEKSRAKTEIWEKWDEFTKEPDKVRKAADALAAAAAAKDEAAVQAKFKELGDACASCHRSFRAPRKAS